MAWGREGPSAQFRSLRRATRGQWCRILRAHLLTSGPGGEERQRREPWAQPCGLHPDARTQVRYFPGAPEQRTATGKLLTAETDSVPAMQATGLKPSRVTLPPGAQGRASLPSPSSWRLPQGFLGSRVSLRPSLCLCHFLSMSNTPPTGKLVRGFKAHLDNPGWSSHLKTLHFGRPAKAFFSK